MQTIPKLERVEWSVLHLASLSLLKPLILQNSLQVDEMWLYILPHDYIPCCSGYIWGRRLTTWLPLLPILSPSHIKISVPQSMHALEKPHEWWNVWKPPQAPYKSVAVHWLSSLIVGFNAKGITLSFAVALTQNVQLHFLCNWGKGYDPFSYEVSDGNLHL